MFHNMYFGFSLSSILIQSFMYLLAYNLVDLIYNLLDLAVIVHFNVFHYDNDLVYFSLYFCFVLYFLKLCY
jgi:hypothetical protein